MLGMTSLVLKSLLKHFTKFWKKTQPDIVSFLFPVPQHDLWHPMERGFPFSLMTETYSPQTVILFCRSTKTN